MLSKYLFVSAFLAESQPALEIDTAPKQQTLGVSLNHEHIGARYIKEEQEEMWSSHEGEQLQGVETFSFGFIPLKTESQEESAVSSPYLVKCKFNLLIKCNSRRRVISSFV